MNCATFLRCVVRPGLAFCAKTLDNARLDTAEAELLLLAIGLQESGCSHRRQQPGPARGYWQFERGGGFVGVLNHDRTEPLLAALVRELDLPSAPDALWLALPESELLQVAFARLLLWSDNVPLPPIGAKDPAWTTYLRLWRPGKPHRDRWDASYQGALDVVRAAGSVPSTAAAKTGDLIDRIEALLRELRSVA